jgi:drug/metabolite transporter (DMT)-like permease
MSPYLLLIAVLALSVYSQLVVKSRALVHAAGPSGISDYVHYLVTMFSDPRALSGVCATVLAGICWTLVIGRLDVSYAFPILALNFVLVPIGSAILFGESLPPTQLVGLLLIVAGVTVNALAH